MKKIFAVSSAVLATLIVFTFAFAGPADEEKKVFAEFSSLIPKDRIVTVDALYNRTKHRAAYFSSFLYRYGYKNIYVVDGGFAAWAEKGYPLYSNYLGEIKVVKYNKNLNEDYQVRQR